MSTIYTVWSVQKPTFPVRYVATFIATLKNEEAKFYFRIRNVQQQSSRMQQNAQTVLLHKYLSIKACLTD
jgi:hypothetical protein